MRFEDATDRGRCASASSYHHPPVRSSLTIHRSPVITHHTPLATLTTRHSPFITRHSPLATRHSPFITRHSPSPLVTHHSFTHQVSSSRTPPSEAASRAIEEATAWDQTFYDATRTYMHTHRRHDWLIGSEANRSAILHVAKSDEASKTVVHWGSLETQPEGEPLELEHEPDNGLEHERDNGPEHERDNGPEHERDNGPEHEPEASPGPQ